MKPPAITRALLLAVACEDTVAGDLEEEFLLVCEASSRKRANRWYRWQVVRRPAPMILLRLRSESLPANSIAALLSVTLPLLLLDRLWSFVYSQIPLKDGVERAPLLLAINLMVACTGAAGVRRSTVSMAAAGFAIWLSLGAAPLLYSALLMVLIPASSVWRRRRA